MQFQRFLVLEGSGGDSWGLVLTVLIMACLLGTVGRGWLDTEGAACASRRATWHQPWACLGAGPDRPDCGLPSRGWLGGESPAFSALCCANAAPFQASRAA